VEQAAFAVSLKRSLPCTARWSIGYSVRDLTTGEIEMHRFRVILVTLNANMNGSMNSQNRQNGSRSLILRRHNFALGFLI
jgi:hypothetical protein